MEHHSTVRSPQYLNIILTINAALLGALVWTQIAGSPALSAAAHASPATQNPPRDNSGGIPNAGGQRERIISELEGIRASIDGLKKSVDAGKLKVTLANIDELKSALVAAAAQGK